MMVRGDLKKTTGRASLPFGNERPYRSESQSIPNSSPTTPSSPWPSQHPFRQNFWLKMREGVPLFRFSFFFFLHFGLKSVWPADFGPKTRFSHEWKKIMWRSYDSFQSSFFFSFLNEIFESVGEERNFDIVHGFKHEL